MFVLKIRKLAAVFMDIGEFGICQGIISVAIIDKQARLVIINSFFRSS
jgi:hypothetical protein